MNWTIEDGCPTIRGKDCVIYLTTRPSYCDRGSYLANLDARGRLAQDLDHADLWPRYYFDLDRAKAECEAWLVKRGQVVKGDVVDEQVDESSKHLHVTIQKDNHFTVISDISAVGIGHIRKDLVLVSADVSIKPLELTANDWDQVVIVKPKVVE